MNITLFSKLKWIGFVAGRYVSKKGQRSRTQSVLSILGIAVGVLSLTVIISVMNGFQLGFIESIIEVSSFHIRVYNFPKENETLVSDIQNIQGVQSAVLFLETKGLLEGVKTDEPGIVKPNFRQQSAALIRGLRPGALLEDRGMAGKLDFEKGGFDLEQRGSILLGAELAASLGLRLGDECEFISISNIVPQDDDTQTARFTVRGIFRTGFWEYDLNWAFVNLEDAAALELPPVDAFQNNKTQEAGYILGIKLKNRENDRQMAAHIEDFVQNIIGEEYILENDIRISSWRNYNKAFFNALRTEKLMMFVLVGLIFIITAMNIYHSQQRSVLERGEEIALLRALGATPLSVRMVFALHGCILGALGATAGMLPALLIVSHIRGFFSCIETIINGVLFFLSLISGGLWAGESYSVFSPAVFYLKEIPARAIPHEIVLIYMFGFLSAVIAAFSASNRVSLMHPADVLRYE
ncbi:MAG: ABC transporter permease [Spirochaetaceae bacterium]|jgi:lipoprotein-releasing system permease protein|nr:ABC transporter permease [Spirochaetaceae bacterium]